MKSIYRYLFLLALIISSWACTHGRPALAEDELSAGDGRLIIWAHADIQPRDEGEMSHYETAVKDIKTLPFVPDMALVAGDLVHRLDSQSRWDWMKGLREQTGIPLWFEIAGNHDLNDRASYLRNSGRPLHYAVRYGNILFIFLSDEIRSAVTDISDGAFMWWRDLVVNNQDSIIVTVTHAALSTSGLIATANWTMKIRDSGRFRDVLLSHPVDLWISGHTHLPNFLAVKSATHEDHPTLFLDVSSIHKSPGSPVESWILLFREGSRTLLCSPRNHEKGVFYSFTALRHELTRPFHRGDGKAVIVSTYEPPLPVRKKMKK
jgi:hypothetical protein